MISVFKQYELIERSDLFDCDFYLANYKDVRESLVDPIMHYIETGAREGRIPSASFNIDVYLKHCESLGEFPENPLLHFILAENATISSTVLKENSIIDRNLVEVIDENAGSIDSWGYSDAWGGWFFNGWIKLRYLDLVNTNSDCVLHFEHANCSEVTTIIFLNREDSNDQRVSIVGFVPSNRFNNGNLNAIELFQGLARYHIQTCDESKFLSEKVLHEQLYDFIRSCRLIKGDKNRLFKMLAAPAYTYQDSLNLLSRSVVVHIDEAIFCPPNSLLIKGWLLSELNVIREIWLCSGVIQTKINLNDQLQVVRPDVIEEVGKNIGFLDPLCGFISYFPSSLSEGAPIFIKVVLQNGEIGYKPINPSSKKGLDAIKSIVGSIDLNSLNLDKAFSLTLGPAIASLNYARFNKSQLSECFDFGEQPADPLLTIIIPVFGRIDYLEYQMAFFSDQIIMKNVEILYVLDDPPKWSEFHFLAKSTFERFRLPFKILVCVENLGFAPANNLGLKYARGNYICFLNSDVFPVTKNWVDILIQSLEDQSDIGVIGARLLFEDGSIQHEGCAYKRVPEFGNWMFIDHPNKGKRPSKTSGIDRFEAITGAFMLLRRSLAMQLKGFDDCFIIGDFEDSDLCRRIGKLGLKSAVNFDVIAYHLERKSQANPDQLWRMNLTLYNAWLHERRWFGKQSLQVLK